MKSLKYINLSGANHIYNKMANLTLRSSTGSPLSFAELDGNFEYFTGSHAVTGSITATSFIGTASYAVQAISSDSSISSSYALNSSYATQAIASNSSISSSYALTASYATQAISSNSSISSSYALTASYALNGGGGGSTSTGSLLTTASFLSPNLTFTKGDATTFDADLSSLNVTNSLTASSVDTLYQDVTINGTLNADILNAGSILNPSTFTGNVIITGGVTAGDGVNNSIFTGYVVFDPTFIPQAIDDAAAASLNVPIGGMYRNVNTLLIRLT
jgi:hypothetical protein